MATSTLAVVLTSSATGVHAFLLVVQDSHTGSHIDVSAVPLQRDVIPISSAK